MPLLLWSYLYGTFNHGKHQHRSKPILHHPIILHCIPVESSLVYHQVRTSLAYLPCSKIMYSNSNSNSNSNRNSNSNDGPVSPFSDVAPAAELNMNMNMNDTQAEYSPATFINPQDDSGPATDSIPSSSATATNTTTNGVDSDPVEAASLFTPTATATASRTNTPTGGSKSMFRSRKTGVNKRQKKNRKRRPRLASYEDRLVAGANNRSSRCCTPCRDRTFVRSTMFVMNILAKILVWSSVIALAAAVIWYSYELTNNGYVTLRYVTFMYRIIS
jgi:hypothetical protein